MGRINFTLNSQEKKEDVLKMPKRDYSKLPAWYKKKSGKTPCVLSGKAGVFVPVEFV